MTGQHPSNIQFAIWNNPRDPNSLRLSIHGFQFVLNTLKIKGYEFEFYPPLTNKNLLQLERYFQGMYYIFQGKKIIVFDEAEASMLNLMNGDLATYLKNLEENHLSE